MTTEEKLKKAIELGEVLKVIYQGGSQPGTLRDIVPISIENGKVRARCINSNAVKLFMIEKIIIADSDKQIEATEWRLGVHVKPHRSYNSISELLEQKQDILVRLGWHIQSNENSLSIHRRFKNGKPRKGPDVKLEYNEYAYDLVVGMDGEMHEENMRKSKRPWSVRCKSKPTRTFGNLGSTANVFMEWANMLAPEKE